MNINKIKIKVLKIKMFREVKKYPRTNKNRSIRVIIHLFKLLNLSAPPTIGIKAYVIYSYASIIYLDLFD